MADRRVRERERRIVGGTFEDTSRWIIERHRAALPSLLPCLQCKGCGCVGCMDVRKQPCRKCVDGMAPLDETVVLGSVFKDRACQHAAGWTPPLVLAYRDALSPGVVECDWVSGQINPGRTAKRDLTLQERLDMLSRMGADQVRRRAVVALVEACLALHWTEPRRRSVGILRGWALHACAAKVVGTFLEYANDSRRLNVSWLPGGATFMTVRSTVESCLAVLELGNIDAYEVIRRDLVPVLVGRGDPLLARVTALEPVE